MIRVANIPEEELRDLVERFLSAASGDSASDHELSESELWAHFQSILKVLDEAWFTLDLPQAPKGNGSGEAL